MPSDGKLDWFSKARRVGRREWDQFKFLLFDPNGILYAATKDGKLYKGSKPDNENVSWINDQATKIGIRMWDEFDALFFDPEGTLYAVTHYGSLEMRSPPTDVDDNWIGSSTTLAHEGWSDLSHFISFSPQGDLWCVDSSNGNIYKGRAPTEDDTNYLEKAEKLGCNYNKYLFLSLTSDKSIQNTVSFQSQPDFGENISEGDKTQNDNKSKVPAKFPFSTSDFSDQRNEASQDQADMEFPDTPDTILFAVDKHFVAKAGLLPRNSLDKFETRSSTVGKLKDVSKIVFSPEGELFAVRGGDMYRGSMPSNGKLDWFSKARRVGRREWDQFKFLLFDPNGILYAATKDGKLYKGPKPDNENVSWINDQATKIGIRMWDYFDALFFDPEGTLYAVTHSGSLEMRSPPSDIEDNWIGSSTNLAHEGWSDLSHFIAFSTEGDLWCVDSSNGNIYKGQAPTNGLTSFVRAAKKFSWNYDMYPFLSLTIDKTIQSIVSFEFLPNSGKILSRDTEVLQSLIYNNKSSVPAKFTFSFTKSISETSTLTHQHGYSGATGQEITFKAGTPLIDEEGVKISGSGSSAHTWNFTGNNETQTTFSSSADIEVPGGKTIRMVASVTKGGMEVPYRAIICTMFGKQTTIQGMWKGFNHYNLMITQEDYQP
ncbi:uncharacterized protein LOC134615269 [Pelobates fuscus]|uniref:uncharacterized protein LOC134615269 n=1 Tax=Pelobates fuscus TaxID=191477 RepID=UPI002FE4AFC5